MEKKWVVVAKGADFNKIAGDFGISPYLARIIRNRGPVTNEEIEMFLNGDVSAMHDPHLMKDMEEAVVLLADAIEAQVPIRIVGDYDIDGVCASFILRKGIESAGGIADVRLPERMKDGYGINENIIKQAHEDGIELIITCDNGIAAADEIELAANLGMSVIVTDHHEVPYEEAEGQKQYRIPSADAVVDPKRSDCTYPFKGICGAMVAYKLISCLYDEPGISDLVENKNALMTEFLSFAGFATVGDLMELTDENRIAVRKALEILSNTSNTGMKALINACGLSQARISAYHIGFVLGPCINASGRLETADAALELFFTEDPTEAAEKAKALVEINIARRNLTETYSKQAVELAGTKYADDKVLVVYLPECHESIAGIVAGRLREHFYKPSIVLTDDSEGNIKGSGRSIETYPMFDELNKVKDLFTKFGGHKMAAGVSLPAGSADELRRRLNENCALSDDELVEKVRIDIPLPIGYVTDSLVEEIDRLEPFGIANPRPLFAQKDIPVRSMNLTGQNNSVLKIILEGSDPAGNVRAMEAVCFNEAERVYNEICDRKTLSIVYQPSFNVYRDRRSVQLVIRDYK